MKKIFNLFILLFIINISFGQGWAPTDATWIYTSIDHSDVQTFNHFHYKKDTTIDGIKTKVIEHKKISRLYAPSGDIVRDVSITQSNQYMYDDNDIIYWWNNGVFVELYHFNTQIGDSWKIHKDPDNYHICGDTAQVDSIIVANKGVEIINNQAFDIDTMSSVNNSWNIRTIINEVGGRHGMFPTFDIENPCVTNLLIDQKRLMCYSDSIRGSLFADSDCPYLLTSTKEATQESGFDNFSIYPNPFQNEITIKYLQSKFQNFTIRVYNMLGQVLYLENISGNNPNINLNHLDSGIYLLSIENEKGNIFNSKIIKN